jgi:hypothetical protein
MMQVLLARDAFEAADSDNREWLIERMYASSRRFYCESVHIYVAVRIVYTTHD